MKKKNKRKVSVKSTLMVLLLMAALLISSTYAWFVSSKTVKIGQLEVEITTVDGLQASVDNGINWKSTITQVDIVGTPEKTNQTNAIPTAAIAPVSTNGVPNAQKELVFFKGIITDDKLTAIAETDNTNYIKFDIKFKSNAVAKLTLDIGSAVTATGSKGLQNATRVAFVNKQDGKIAIWEPNANKHTAGGISNAAAYGKTGVSESAPDMLAYNGLSKAITEGKTVGDESDTETFKAVTTVTTAAPVNQFIEIAQGFTDFTVYMWIEGQDVDCENMASGDNIQFQINLTKP